MTLEWNYFRKLMFFFSLMLVNFACFLDVCFCVVLICFSFYHFTRTCIYIIWSVYYYDVLLNVRFDLTSLQFLINDIDYVFDVGSRQVQVNTNRKKKF